MLLVVCGRNLSGNILLARETNMNLCVVPTGSGGCCSCSLLVCTLRLVRRVARVWQLGLSCRRAVGLRFRLL